MDEIIKAEILTIGDEILYGQILDTNSQWISDVLDRAGIRITQKTTVGDNESDILRAFREAEDRADIVLITGGLGPTKDDLTKPLLARYFDCPMEPNPDALRQVSEFFQSKGLELTPVNELQATLPVCCEVVENKLGTAPGMWFHRDGKVFVSMPGVPHEMKKMMTDTVIPRLHEVFETAVIYHKLIKTIGIGESWLASKIQDWEDALPENIRLAYLPSLGQVKLRLTAFGTDRSVLEEQVAEQIEKLKPLAGNFIYGFNGDEIQEVIGRMLCDQCCTIATAESCTGGYLSHLITSVPGSSEYYVGSVIAYENTIKEALLGVQHQTLLDHGAVSEETALEMAAGIRKRTGAKIGVSTTGIAGPGGGTPEKPVGTVWIAYDDGKEAYARKLQLWKDRDVNIRATAVAVLNMIRIRLSKTIEVTE
ncbi:competence/damage-inducible protein A [Fulvivirga sedimenti]|uniref:CinA-like protein n=1 Tax=Fulvivirga sedimenti TaxID=2879465 RepID=A0A9X1HSU9_9BACT|nr:competence/damage-inducible protein A [Fulvivirga sedimenti]MCA6075374.1 competence/damage-inducible protein A [Fulvivirga sedimenti]MCA6076551.1 competence/damage-inducible protein A [Fulvivirga sedimenti]MCA6077679.1 competence/damage-inducible protein A [Fulvivirga sedimenti]